VKEESYAKKSKKSEVREAEGGSKRSGKSKRRPVYSRKQSREEHSKELYCLLFQVGTRLSKIRKVLAVISLQCWPQFIMIKYSQESKCLAFFSKSIQF
jgi:hypothetical protein